VPKGVFRRVLLVGPWALKLPRIRNLPAGLRCNRWEREVWQRWRPAFGWEGLCPVLFADPFGLVVVMPRAEQPVSQAEAHAAVPDHYPAPWCEGKPQDYGRVAGRVVALDYGIPYSDFLLDHRRDLLAALARQGGA